MRCADSGHMVHYCYLLQSADCPGYHQMDEMREDVWTSEDKCDALHSTVIFNVTHTRTQLISKHLCTSVFSQSAAFIQEEKNVFVWRFI